MSKINFQYVLSLSYGKDSIACLGAIEKLGLSLDRIVHAEVWATQDIPADLPPMVEFKAKADEWIFDHYGIRVEHICAMKRSHDRMEKLTYEDIFYRLLTPRSKAYQKWTHSQTAKSSEQLYTGFPYTPTRAGGGGWCHELKHILSEKNLQTTGFSDKRLGRAADTSIVQYLEIAADEPERIKRHTKPGYAMPLVEAGWDEAYCRAWCEERGMLSPIYTTATRGGCWFCHNQGVDQLRLLHKNYPEYWAILLRWDSDSPVSFHPDGHTVHDFDRRFAAEDAGRINPNDKRFRWWMLDEPEQMRMI